MTSPRAKGHAYQRWVQSWLERQGFKVHNEPLRTRLVVNRAGARVWAQVHNDILGCVDLVAKRADLPTVWIQATMDKAVEKRLTAFDACPFHADHDLVFLFQKVNERRHRIFRYYANRGLRGVLVQVGGIILDKLEDDCYPFRTPDRKEKKVVLAKP